MNPPNNLDPTAGERARALSEGRPIWPPVTDPTAGTRARLLRYPHSLLLVTDPTNPRCGQPLDSVEDLVA
jgi:hypothetical protein